LSKVANFNLPHLHLQPSLGMAPFEFCRELQHQKTRIPGLSCGVVCVILHLAVLVSTPTCDIRQTHDYGICRASTASRVKKNNQNSLHVQISISLYLSNDITDGQMLIESYIHPRYCLVLTSLDRRGRCWHTRPCSKVWVPREDVS